MARLANGEEISKEYEDTIYVDPTLEGRIGAISRSLTGMGQAHAH